MSTNEARAPILNAAVVSRQYPLVSGLLTDRALWARVIRYGRCTDAALDPDEWFPISTEAGQARLEAAAALAVCASCPVRAECLALSLQHWDIGQHGVWGGLVAADRARLRRRLAAKRGFPLPVSGNDRATAVRPGWWRLLTGRVAR